MATAVRVQLSSHETGWADSHKAERLYRTSAGTENGQSRLTQGAFVFACGSSQIAAARREAETLKEKIKAKRELLADTTCEFSPC